MARMPKTGRNDRCPCGSGKKHKACCGVKAGTSPWAGRMMIALLVLLVAGGIAAGLSNMSGHGSSASAAPGKVWSPEHGHFH